MKILITFIMMVMAISALHAKVTPNQLSTLQTVRDIARTVPDAQGETYENTLAAICLTESSAGRDVIGDFRNGVDITKASLGAMQVQVATARFVAERVDKLAWLKTNSDKQIANLLLTDLHLSATIAAHYFVILKNSRRNYMKSVSGYNGGMENWPYFGRVMKHMKLVKKLVASGKLK